MKLGRQLQSVRFRFTALIAAACLICCMIVWMLVAKGHPIASSPFGLFSMLVIITAVPALLALRLSGTLASSVETLRANVDAMLTSDNLASVMVDHAGEVGELAESLGRVVDRMNSDLVKMNILAYNDPLTGLPNRRVVQHALDRAIGPTAAPGFVGALFFIDLDGFKRVNDTLGHEAGDLLLKESACRIAQDGFGSAVDALDSGTSPLGKLRDQPLKSTMVARFAGDEFVAFVPDCANEAELLQIADRIVQALLRPFQIGGHSVSISASVGIARTPVDSIDAEELIAFADIAMYESKSQGKARATLFHQRLREATVARRTLERELRNAIRDHELTLEYQPKVHAQKETLVGVEALVRWRHPQHGRVSADLIVELAEQGGMMRELGEFVLQSALVQARNWFLKGKELPVAVNVSASQFRDPDFVSKVANLLATTMVPPRLLELEVTESAAMDDFTAAGEKLTQLQEMGVKTTIDDFGVGFSNLNQLVNLPFNSLKIDKSLVSGIGWSERSESVIIAVVGIALALGYQTVAEGIETEDQRDFMKRYQCTHLQGYLLGKPMTANVLANWRGRFDEADALDETDWAPKAMSLG